jgi:E3 SUMO-protein ligase PIAS1
VRRYFNSILESTPDTVEDVIVEADGEWHTSDDRYASGAWKKNHKSALLLASPTPQPTNQATTAAAPFGHVYDTLAQEMSQNPGDVVVLDSEEEDEGEVKRELSPSRPSPMNGLLDTQVIDLTLESDEESVSGRSLGRKRKAEVDPEFPTDDIWKKSRIGDPLNASTVTRTMNGNVTNSASDVFVSGSNYGARHYVNGASLQHRPDGAPYAPVSHTSSPYTAPYFPQPSRMVTPSSGQFGPQVSHRAGYYS